MSDNIKQDCNAAAEGARCPNIKGAAKLKGNGCVSGSQASSWENCDGDDPSSDDDAEGTESKGGGKSKRMETDTEVDAPYPEPRLPYPCMSSLSAHEQKAHVGYMLSNKTRSPTQVPASPDIYFPEIVSLLFAFMFVFSDISGF